MMKLRLIGIMAVASIAMSGCDEKGSDGEADQPSAPTTAVDAASSEADPSKEGPVPWSEAGEPETRFEVRKHDGGLTLVQADTSVAELVPTLITRFSESPSGDEKVVETSFAITRVTADDAGGLAFYLEAEDELGTWKIRGEHGVADPRLKFALSGKFSRDVVLHEQSLVFSMPGESAPQLLTRTYDWAPVGREAVTDALTPIWVRWPSRQLTLRGVAGLDRAEVARTETGWKMELDTYASARHPMRVDPSCKGAASRDDAAARLAKKSKVEARWHLVAGTPDVVLPSRYPRAKTGAVALIVTDDEPTLERTMALDIADTRNDGDGLIEFGVGHTKVVRSGPEGIEKLGTYPSRTRVLSVEVVPGDGPPEAKPFTTFGDVQTWYDLPADGDCSAVYRKGAIEGAKPLQARIDAGFRYFWDGTMRSSETLGMLGEEPPLYPLPHSMARGTPEVWLFQTVDATTNERFSQLVEPEQLRQLAKEWQLSFVTTTTDALMTGEEGSWSMEPTALSSAMMLARFGLDQRVAVGPVSQIAGHVAAMSEVAVEYLPGGWTRVRNLGQRDLFGATFILPDGATATFPTGAPPEVDGQFVYFDLPARGERLFRISKKDRWLAPARFELVE